MMPPKIAVQLIHIHGGLKGEIQDFLQTPITVGRLSTCCVKFPPNEPGVSRKHASIEREGNQFKLIDLSRFGTFVNGKQVQEVFLRSGDVITFGPGGPKASITMEVTAAPHQPAYPAFPDPAPPRCAAPAPRPHRSEPPSEVAIPGATPSCPPPAPPLPEAARAMVPLVIQFGPTIRAYRELPVTIGSHSAADFVAQHAGLRDRHAEFFFQENAYWVKDLTGGLVTVNGRPVGEGTTLALNDKIECSAQGPVFHFLGEGRLAEVEPTEDQGEEQIPDQDHSHPPVHPGGSFFARFVKGLKHQ